jgi:hypothetical protein
MRIALLIAIINGAAYAQGPTLADLDATIAKWNEYAKPGRVMRTKADSSVFLAEQGLFPSVEKAYAMGDHEISIGLVKKGLAFVVEGKVRVRLIGFENKMCQQFRQITSTCYSTEHMMRTGGTNALSPKYRRIMKGQGSNLDALLKRIGDHDISEYIAEEYARVRILDGEHVGEDGWIKLSELE